MPSSPTPDLTARPSPRSADGAMPGGVLFRATGVGVRRGDDWLIEGVDLTINPGEIVTLIGPNGSGKTTTAKIVLGLLRPDAGRIERAGALRIGYVPQRLTIDDTLPFTVRRLMTMTGPATDTEIDRALERAGGRPFGRGRGSAPVRRRISTHPDGPGNPAQTGPVGFG